MLLSDYIALVVVATMLARVRSLATITSNVLLHCRATNALATAKGTNEEDKTTLPQQRIEMLFQIHQLSHPLAAYLVVLAAYLEAVHLALEVLV